MADGGVLARLGEKAAARAASGRRERPEASLKSEPLYARTPRSLAAALSGPAPRVIAEVKFASPSEGILRPGASSAEAARLAGAYLDAGAAAVSILTEPEAFSGDPSYLASARSARPEALLLMKDFVVDAWQFALARSIGADAILLISALLGPRLPELLAASRAFGLSALVEVHDEAEAESALAAGAEVLGVNSRNLRTLKTDLGVARRLAPFARRAASSVAESGLRSRADLDELGGLGYTGFLIGTSFMKTPDPAAALAALRK
ncbi:MAG: indole-3-glycerol-phosphate synthase [Elusimicrobia bacterium]|nr:indole-3-glycerol-phosphate synthase [Elusimicrobiota bacterium]